MGFWIFESKSGVSNANYKISGEAQKGGLVSEVVGGCSPMFVSFLFCKERFRILTLFPIDIWDHKLSEGL